MAKNQRGNKEAKKPKQAKKTVPPALPPQPAGGRPTPTPSGTG